MMLGPWGWIAEDGVRTVLEHAAMGWGWCWDIWGQGVDGIWDEDGFTACRDGVRSVLGYVGTEWSLCWTMWGCGGNGVGT